MARKSKGFVELFWDCPRCGSRNPGMEKTCIQCGAPQPEDVQFYQIEKQELITDEEKLKAARRGPDIHCPYCGARNPADAETCSQCGGDLTTGYQREAGRVVGAFKEGEAGTIICPNCATENPEDRSVCMECGAVLHSQVDVPDPVQKQPASSIPQVQGRRSRVGLLFLLIFLLLCGAVVAFLVMANRTDTVRGTVDSVRWERSVVIEAQVPVQFTEWQDMIPAEAEIISCSQEVRFVRSEPVENSIEVCGTPYNVDTGSGAAEVVQDCEYHVIDNFCTYSTLVWEPVDVVVTSGTDYSGFWPSPDIGDNQRLGNREENYQVYFETSDGLLGYTTTNYDLFQQLQVGTRWDLNVNTFGNISSISP